MNSNWNSRTFMKGIGLGLTSGNQKTKMETKQGFALSKISPSFLHANSTSHTWAFSAIAELIDNAYDPDVNANELWIDKEEVNGKTCLTFTDNGSGLNPDNLLKMMSFGFCEKSAYENNVKHKPIGHYGNGFKSGSMRIANDAIIFTRHTKEMSVGMLSQTFLKRTEAETVVVPLISWNISTGQRPRTVETINNIRAITTFSHYKTEKSLVEELEKLEQLGTGTKIVLFNLKSDESGKLELDLESDITDILNPQTLEIDTTSVYRPVQEASPLYITSLREYCSILFLTPRMKIVLRGKKVKTKLLCKSLSQTETDTYKPLWLNKPIKITFGFTCSGGENDEYGIMMYHRNRLIKAFEKVGYQKQPNELGVGVVGVVEVNFLQPTHNKQDFNKDERYNTFMAALSRKTDEYWNVKRRGSNLENASRFVSDWLWAQCDNCLKWRRLPDGINRNLPEKWFCYMNPDASHNRCEIPEEPEDEDLSLQYAADKKNVRKELQQEKFKVKVEVASKKELELIAKEQKLKEQAKTVQMICTELTNSEAEERRKAAEERKRAEMFKKELDKAKRQETEQRKIIEQLRKARNMVQENQQNMCRAAQNLHVQDFNATTVTSTVDSAEIPSLQFSSAVKRKRVENNEASGISSNKIVIQSNEGDDIMEVIPDITMEKEVVDLTSSDDHYIHIKPNPILVEKNQQLMDKKPNLKELEKKVDLLKKQNSVCHNETQTSITIKSLEEQTQLLERCTQQLEETKKHHSKLQKDIHKLLSIVLPTTDLGDVCDIEKIVLEMIIANQE